MIVELNTPEGKVTITEVGKGRFLMGEQLSYTELRIVWEGEKDINKSSEKTAWLLTQLAKVSTLHSL